MQKVTAGAGSCLLTDWRYGVVYPEYGVWAASLLDVDDLDQVLFLDALHNGGVRGDGLKALRKAAQLARRQRKRLLFTIIEFGPAYDRLERWYLRTGLVRKVGETDGLPWFEVAEF